MQLWLLTAIQLLFVYLVESRILFVAEEASELVQLSFSFVLNKVFFSFCAQSSTAGNKKVSLTDPITEWAQLARMQP